MTYKNDNVPRWFRFNFKELTFFLVILIGVTLLTYGIVFRMASSLCTETKEVPIRYESQGLFGVLHPIETTKENMDGMGRVCTKTGEPSFWDLSGTLDFLINNGRELNE